MSDIKHPMPTIGGIGVNVYWHSVIRIHGGQWLSVIVKRGFQYTYNLKETFWHWHVNGQPVWILSELTISPSLSKRGMLSVWDARPQDVRVRSTARSMLTQEYQNTIYMSLVNWKNGVSGLLSWTFHGDEVGVILTLWLPVKSPEEKCGHVRMKCHSDKLVNTDTLSREQDYMINVQSCAIPDKTPIRGDTFLKTRTSPSSKRRDRKRRRECGRNKGSPTSRPLVGD
jgi:hypothetical protein